MSVSADAAGRRPAIGTLSLPWIIGCLLGRHADRVVRLLSLRRARAVFQQAFLLAGAEPDGRLHCKSFRVLDGFPRSALWRNPLWPSGRPDRPQIHLHANLGIDGSGDLRRRPVAGLCRDRGPRTDPAGHACGSCRVSPLGGEYGGAATYIAEHAPDGRRGLYTSWIQTTATMGIVLALLVILICRLVDRRPSVW